MNKKISIITLIISIIFTSMIILKKILLQIYDKTCWAWNTKEPLQYSYPCTDTYNTSSTLGHFFISYTNIILKILQPICIIILIGSIILLIKYKIEKNKKFNYIKKILIINIILIIISLLFLK